MSQMQIARVDAIPLLFAWMQRMEIADQIDAHWTTHRVWAGLSYGQLTVLFLIFLIHERDHRLSALEPWVLAHHATLTAVTGWTIRREDVTDDRLGHLLGVIGKSPAQMTVLQQALGRHLVRAYALPTTIARVDTTSFNVTHAPSPDGQSERALLQFGYSKDQRPDLLQCKQTLTTLDPGGVPLLSTTLPGNHADDPCYLPAWRELVALLGHASCLFVADSKAAALETRATMAAGAGRYLFPVPMTGAVPALLRGWVAQPPVTPEPIVLPPTLDDPDEPRTVGEGFVVTRTMTGTTDSGEAVTWEERWLVVQSTAYAERQQAAFDAKLERVATQIAAAAAYGNGTGGGCPGAGGCAAETRAGGGLLHGDGDGNRDGSPEERHARAAERQHAGGRGDELHGTGDGCPQRRSHRGGAHHAGLALLREQHAHGGTVAGGGDGDLPRGMDGRAQLPPLEARWVAGAATVRAAGMAYSRADAAVAAWLAGADVVGMGGPPQPGSGPGDHRGAGAGQPQTGHRPPHGGTHAEHVHQHSSAAPTGRRPMDWHGR